MSRPVPNPGILDIAPYTPGKSPVPEPGRKVFKLSANETPFGPSPKAIEAYKQRGRRIWRTIRKAPRGCCARRSAAPSGSIPTASSAAPARTKSSICWRTPISAMATRRSPPRTAFWSIRSRPWRTAPRTWSRRKPNFTADVDAILKPVTPRTKLVWLANPNNPTGTYLPFDEVKRLRAGLPAHVLLVLDAAYSDYVSRNDYELGIELVATTDNTVMTHTFSKIHGLAALRIGWMFGPAHIVDAVNRIRGPFNVSTPAMLAAVAAIEDTAHQQMSKAHTEKWRNWLTEEIGKLGLKVTPSVANFVLIHFPPKRAGPRPRPMRS